MKTGVLITGVALCLAALYLSGYGILFWAGILLLVAGAVWPEKKKIMKKKEKEETVLHPVIYEDEGEPPYLYPPKFKITYKTKDYGPYRGASNIAKGVGALGKGLYKLGEWLFK